MTPDFTRAPNIAGDPATYEVGNAALDREDRLWAVLRAQRDWAGRSLVDLGCGTGFWLPRYREGEGAAARVVGVEPDADLLALARERVATAPGVEVLAGSAEHLPLPDSCVDLVHARFAYFWGDASTTAGLAEVRRVLRPGGALVVIDNDHVAGEFAGLLAAAGTAFAARDQREVDAWWEAQGARRTPVLSSWTFDTRADLAAVLRLELPGAVAEGWLAAHPGRTTLSYGFVVFTVAG